jgi:FKBP-type peptidyl-prolyl cis-trans isomerase FkpA
MKKLKNLFFIFLLSSCSTYSDKELRDFDAKILTYIEKSNLKFKKSESGLRYSITKYGEGKFIQYTDSVSITYSGFLLNGKRFEYQKEPLKFAVRDLIAGWKEVLLFCQKGTELQMIIPPSIAYGNYDLEDIPQNSILKFQMKVWDVK